MKVTREKVHLAVRIGFIYYHNDIISHRQYINTDFDKVASSLTRKQLRDDLKYLKGAYGT